MSDIIDVLLEHGYTAEQGAATGLYLCALLLMGYTVEAEYEKPFNLYRLMVLKMHDDRIEKIGGAQHSNLASAFAMALGVAREHVGVAVFSQQLDALVPPRGSNQ